MKNHGILSLVLLIILLAVFCFQLQPFSSGTENLVLFASVTAVLGIGGHRIARREIKQLEGQVEELKERLKRFNFEVQVASSQIASVSEQLCVTLEENNVFTQQVFDETREMARSNGQVNENIHSTIISVNQVVELIQEAQSTMVEMKETSSKSRQVIQGSLHEIFDVVSTIHSIQGSVEGTVVHMQTLNTASEKITGILETVNGIARQTNLLALNASIEAARAGEAGKGFGVVAKEIRKLAQSTGEAVKDIGSLVMGIRHQVHQVYGMVQENSMHVEKGVKVSGSIESSLGSISTSFGRVLDMAEKLNRLSEGQVNLTHEVENQVAAVEVVITMTSGSVEDVYNSVHRQKHSMEDIAVMSSRLNEASRCMTELLGGTGLGEMDESSRRKIAEASSAFQAICSQLHETPAFVSLDRDVHRRILPELVRKYDFMEAVWTNDARGRFLCSVPEAGIANAVVREWFKSSIQGTEYSSPIYISAITKKPCVTISAPILDKEERIKGVIGMDVKL